MRLSIRAGDDVLVRYGNALGALGDYGARKVMARALNRTGGPTLTAVRRALALQTSAPMGLIRRQVVGKKAWAGNATGTGKLEFVITATGRPISLRYFRPRETRKGVRAKVYGRTQQFDGTFMYGGVFGNRSMIGREKLSGNVFKRTTSARLPIEKLYGPALAPEMVKDQAAETFKGMTFRLARDLDHELYRALPR